MSDYREQIDELRKHGWEQGSVLSPVLVELARTQTDGRWPTHIQIGPEDWLIVVSHDCDVLNRKFETEPTVEVVVVRPHQGPKPDSRAAYGKNSRTLHFRAQQGGADINLVASASDRFLIRRPLLAKSPPDPDRRIDRHVRGMLASWLAKRYQRQAFPDAFDAAVSTARAKPKVDAFLVTHAKELLGVFVAIANRANLAPRFHVEFRLVVRQSAVGVDWPNLQARLALDFEACWANVEGVEVDVATVQANSFSIGEMSSGGFQKFDRDWISYEFDPDSGPAPES